MHYKNILQTISINGSNFKCGGFMCKTCFEKYFENGIFLNHSFLHARYSFDVKTMPIYYKLCSLCQFEIARFNYYLWLLQCPDCPQQREISKFSVCHHCKLNFKCKHILAKHRCKITDDDIEAASILLQMKVGN